MTTERDDLAREIFIADNHKQPREQSIVDWDWFNETPRFTVRVDHYKDLADGLIAAGYTRTRTRTTVEELRAAGDGAVVLSEQGGVWECQWDDGGPYWVTPGNSDEIFQSDQLALPATVLHEGAGA